jgi:hypothetical protein
VEAAFFASPLSRELRHSHARWRLWALGMAPPSRPDPDASATTTRALKSPDLLLHHLTVLPHLG